ncbi:MAG: T9SS type A sorting domain-containing protein [Flavobacteriia bacterium]|nr:T9SS type A sorting domain-containing protein [Flavobacteriia bacterium]
MLRINKLNQRLLRQVVPIVASFFVAVGISHGQSYYHSPNDTLIATTTVDYSVTMNITQVHPTLDTVYFKWKKLLVDMPAEWEATICDNTTCYPSLIDSGYTLPVLPGDDGLMLVHCYPLVTSGTGVIRYTIFSLATPEQVDTLTWIINANSTASVMELTNTGEVFSIKGDLFTLENQHEKYTKLRLIDVNGKPVFTQLINDQQTIRLPLLPAAAYVVELWGEKSITRKKIWYAYD